MAIIGSEETVLPFRSIGLQAYPADNVQSAEDILNRIITEGFSVIYLEESYAALFAGLIDRLNKEYTATVLTVIPGARGGSDFALKRLGVQVKKAIGMDIFAEGS
jgi:vacuolar-type H+-ATPase subunit F/Vma7